LGVHTRTIQNWESGTKIPASKHAILRNLEENVENYIEADENPDLIPKLPISAQGGSLNDFFVAVKDTDCEKVVSPVKGADFAMTVAGDSMWPEYPGGSQ